MSNLEHRTDTSDAIKEAFKKCEEFIENSTPEELQEYEKSLGINPDDYCSHEERKEP